MSVKITPKIPANKTDRLCVNDLGNGEFFLYDGELYQVVEGMGYCISEVENKAVECDHEYYEVIPVDVEIKWSYPKKGKKGKK